MPRSSILALVAALTLVGCKKLKMFVAQADGPDGDKAEAALAAIRQALAG